MAKAGRLVRAEAALRQFALAYPEAYEEFPWGERAIKIKGKTFLFLYLGKDFLSLSVKLPVSGKTALAMPFASPTAYGLGKSGWVTARFGATDDVPTDMLKEWLDESFRAIAPKKLLAQLETAEGAGGKPRRNKKQPASEIVSRRPRRST